MKLINGIISVLLGLGSLYVMFFKSNTDQEFIMGFGMLLMSIVFMCFMIMSEQKDEIEWLRYRINKDKNII
jgi:heme/copper-type cytochrome/quinol oxidase subunit 4